MARPWFETATAEKIQFSEPTMHALENSGTTGQHVLLIELKK